MSKSSNAIKLPDRYPRTEEILIFGDMSELDHMFDLLDKLKTNLYALLPDVTDDKWKETVNFSGINQLITGLRKTCYEVERFWQGDGWKPENDKEFMEYMNDPDKLNWLVIFLDSGRIKPVEGKNTMFYQPAYHAAARSLQMAMYIKWIPGDKDWIDYCINELRYNLTRYHAAALEIIMHRENVYLHNKEVLLLNKDELLHKIKPYAEIGKKYKTDRKRCAEASGFSNRKHSEEDKKKWVEEAKRIQLDNPANKSASALARLVIEKLDLPDSFFESIREELRVNGIKAYEKTKPA